MPVTTEISLPAYLTDLDASLIPDSHRQPSVELDMYTNNELADCPSRMDQDSIIEISQLCILASQSRETPTDAELKKETVKNVEKLLRKLQGKTSRKKPDDKAMAEAALKERKQKLKAKRAYEEMEEEVVGPLRRAVGKFERGRAAARTDHKTAVANFEKQLKDAAKKTEELGRSRHSQKSF